MPQYTVWLYEHTGAAGKTYTRLYHAKHESGMALATTPDGVGRLWTHSADWADPDFVAKERRLVAKGVIEAPDLVTLNQRVAAHGLNQPLGVMERAAFLVDMARATDLPDLAVEAGTQLAEAQRRLRAVDQLIEQIEKE